MQPIQKRDEIAWFCLKYIFLPKGSNVRWDLKPKEIFKFPYASNPREYQEHFDSTPRRKKKIAWLC